MGYFSQINGNFIIDAINIEDIPSYSTAYIDIYHDSFEAKAICEITGGSKNTFSNISCIADYENQKEDDVITINTNKNHGTIEWSPSISEQEKTEIEHPDKKEIELSFDDAYDMYFSNNKWIFTILATNTKKVNPGGKYITDIHYISSKNQEKDSTATCLLKEGMKNSKKILFICICDYNSQDKKDLIQIGYPKSNSSSITWKSGIKGNYKIVLKASLTLVKAYNLKLDTYWNFNIDILGEDFPLESKVIINIYKNNILEIVNCTYNSLNNFFCLTNIKGNNNLISLTDARTLSSSVVWENNLQNDYRIYLVTELNYDLSYNLFFNETDNKWHFSLKVITAIVDSKVIIDILYGDKFSTATCIIFKGFVLQCIVDESNQNKMTLIKISFEKTDKSTVTFKGTKTNSDNISLKTDLTFSKLGYLRMNPQEKWIFDLYVKDENIPENSKIIVDIYYHQFSSGSFRKIFKYGESVATCFYNNKRLDCEADSEVNGNEYAISLKTEKTIDSISTVINWKNVDTTKVPILLVTSLIYNFCTKIKFVEDKYIFYCEIHQNTKIPRESEVIIDILIDNRPSISNCKAENQTSLKCEIKKEEYKENKILVSYKKTYASTITWKNLKENQYLFPIKLNFVNAYDQVMIGDHYLTFKMLANGNDLKDGLYLNVKIMSIIRYRDQDREEIIYNAVCEVFKSVLFCFWNIIPTGYFPETDKYYFLLKEEGDEIEWINFGNYYIENEFYKLNYNELKEITYNNEKRCYEFLLNAYGNYNSSSKLVLDLLIRKTNAYAYCHS